MSKIKFITLQCFFVLVSCAGPYTYRDNGKRIELSDEDFFEVLLEGETNSAFAWHLEGKPSFVSLESTDLSKTADNKIEYTFKFKTVAQGKEKVVLIYSNGQEIKKSFDLNVVVGTLGSIL